MSFSDDLDAVRQRAGIPTVYRIQCKGHPRIERLVTIDPRRAERFLAKHANVLAASSPRITYLEGPARFRIKRFPLGSSTDPVWPWRVHDAERPGVFGRARTHAAAVELAALMRDRPGAHAFVTDDDDEVLAYVNGTMPRDPFDYPPAMVRRHVNAPCSVVPILKPEPGSIPLIEVPPCDCGSVDKYGDDIGEHSPSCLYHLAALELTRMGVDDKHLNAMLKRARRA